MSYSCVLFPSAYSVYIYIYIYIYIYTCIVLGVFACAAHVDITQFMTDVFCDGDIVTYVEECVCVCYASCEILHLAGPPCLHSDSVLAATCTYIHMYM